MSTFCVFSQRSRPSSWYLSSSLMFRHAVSLWSQKRFPQYPIRSPSLGEAILKLLLVSGKSCLGSAFRQFRTFLKEGVQLGANHHRRERDHLQGCLPYRKGVVWGHRGNGRQTCIRSEHINQSDCIWLQSVVIVSCCFFYHQGSMRSSICHCLAQNFLRVEPSITSQLLVILDNGSYTILHM